MSKQTQEAIQTINPLIAKECIRTAIQINRPYMLWGPPGIGKSEIVHQVGEELGRKVRDIRLALCADPSDIKGLPYMMDGKMKWAPSAEFPQDPESSDILFLDEIVSAPPPIQGAAYQLILNGRVGEYILPKNCRIIAAGNRENDRGIVYKMPKPLENRFIHGELSVDVDVWLSHAIKLKLHKDIVGFISHMKQDLFNFDATSASHAFATPRSWFFVDQLLKDSKNLSSECINSMLSGSVGEGVAIKFINHRKVVEKLPYAIDILQGKCKSLERLEISATYSLIISLCYELKDQLDRKKVSESTLNEYLENYLNFLMNNFEPEMIVAGVKILISNYNVDFNVMESKSYDAFYSKYGKYFRN